MVVSPDGLSEDLPGLLEALEVMQVRAYRDSSIDQGRNTFTARELPPGEAPKGAGSGDGPSHRGVERD